MDETFLTATLEGLCSAQQTAKAAEEYRAASSHKARRNMATTIRFKIDEATRNGNYHTLVKFYTPPERRAFDAYVHALINLGYSVDVCADEAIIGWGSVP